MRPKIRCLSTIFLAETNLMDIFQTSRIFYHYFELHLVIFLSRLNNN